MLGRPVKTVWIRCNFLLTLISSVRALIEAGVIILSNE